MHYFINFKVSWVTTWEFDYNGSPKYPHILVLIRKYKTKWWDGFKFGHRTTEQSIRNWLINRIPIKIQSPSNSSFLQQKSKYIAAMVVVQVQTQFVAMLKQTIVETEGSQEESSSHHSENTNEDDCYGIDLGADEE